MHTKSTTLFIYKLMNENQNDALNYYPQDFQTKPEHTSQQGATQNFFGQNELMSMLLSGKFKNPFESNPLFNAISSMQKMNLSQETEKSFDEDFFEEP